MSTLHTRASARSRLRSYLSSEDCFHPAPVFDPLSARLAEREGFEIGMLGGSIASLAVLGDPDLTLITLTELAEQVRRICRASALPLVVDADHGYGNALNVRRTVQELDAAGVTALTIEDTALPAPFGTTSPTLISLDEAVGKMKAACGARLDPATVIVARTTLDLGGLDAAIARLRQYEATGVDALHVNGVKSREELSALRDALNLPMILAELPSGMTDRGYLARQRVRICLAGHFSFMAAVKAAHVALRAIRNGKLEAGEHDLPSPELMKEVTRVAEYQSMSEAYLSGGRR